MTGIFEKQPGGGFIELNVRGRLISRTGGTDNYEDVTVVGIGDSFDPQDFEPLPPLLSGVMTSRTVVDLSWAPQTQSEPHEAVDHWEIFRQQDGGGFALNSSVPVAATTLHQTGLATNTPEIIWSYRVYAVSASGLRRSSNEITLQWAATPLSQPTPPTQFTASVIDGTSVHLTWAATADATVTKYGIFSGTTILVNDIPPSALQYDWSGLTTGQTYSNITLRRYNAWGGGTVPGWSNASNSVTFKPLNREVLFTGHVPGKVYLGWSSSEDDDVAEDQLDTQTPFSTAAPSGVNYGNLLGVFRMYNKLSTISQVDAKNKVLWLSGKPDELGSASPGAAGWAQIANGSVSDATLRNYFNSLDARNKLTVWTFHHEPMGDAANATDAANYCAAFLRIMQLVDSTYGGVYDATSNPTGHKFVFCPNYEEFKLRTPGAINWAQWVPENMMPGKGGPRPWDLITFDMYQYNANTSTSATAGVQFSHRWWRINNLFTGAFTPSGSTAMPYMDYTPGFDITFGIGEGTARPGTFYNFEQNNGGKSSNMTGAKYTRDYLDYVFAHPDQFAFVSWFNTIGADHTYNDERLWPDDNSWGGDAPNHPSFVQQTGDTEYTINIYREKLRGGNTVKLASNGLPPT